MASTTRILHVIASFNPVIGGPAEVVRNLILAHSKLDIDAEVVCLDKPDASFLHNDPFPFTIQALGHTDRFWFFSPKLITWLRENINRFTVVIVHGLWLYPSYAVHTVMQELNKSRSEDARPVASVPLVLIFPHGMLDPYFQQTAQRRFKAIRNWFYWTLIERRVVHGANALLFTCETELLLAQRTFSPYQPKQEINVGNGIVEPPPFSVVMADAFLETCPQVTSRSYLLFLSRIHSKKGVDLLISAYAAIIEAQLNVKDRLPLLVIAGPGLDTPYGESIRQLIQKHPAVEDMIFFPGMLTGPAKWGAIYGCEAFSLPSHQENFGIVVAEALACSKPVLISNQVNIWREIVEGGSGLIGSDSLEGTQQVIEQWLSMSSREQYMMSQNARKTFENYFQMEQVIQRLNNVFDTLS